MTMFEIRKTYRFCSSHRLFRPEWSDEENREVFGSSSLAPGHGHNFRLTVVVRGPAQRQSGRVLDLGDLDALIEERVIAVYDHKNLNRDVPSLEGRVTTVETLMLDCWRRISGALPGGLLSEIHIQVDENLVGVYRGPDVLETGPWA